MREGDDGQTREKDAARGDGRVRQADNAQALRQDIRSGHNRRGGHRSEHVLRALRDQGRRTAHEVRGVVRARVRAARRRARAQLRGGNVLRTARNAHTAAPSGRQARDGGHTPQREQRDIHGLLPRAHERTGALRAGRRGGGRGTRVHVRPHRGQLHRRRSAVVRPRPARQPRTPGRLLRQSGVPRHRPLAERSGRPQRIA